MTKLWVSLLLAISIPGALAGPRLQMSDRVRKMSISPNGKTYDVVFARHAAYYHVRVRSPASQCLLRSMDQKIEVTVSGDAKTLVITKCSRNKS